MALEILIPNLFPSNHIRHGERTRFSESIRKGNKIHQIFPLKDMIDNIKNNKNAIIKSYASSINKPSKSILKELSKESGFGYEILHFYNESYANIHSPLRNKSNAVKYKNLCKNEGLSLDDFNSWYDNIDTTQEYIIVHFTKFRYNELL